MFFRFVLVMLTSGVLLSCSHSKRLRQMQDSRLSLGLSVPDALPQLPVEEPSLAQDTVEATQEGPIIMNAIKDTETGEMVATDVIRPSSVTARFRNVAERGGYVSIGFDVTVPQQMRDSRWKLRIDPQMRIADETETLEPVFIAGSRYRKGQMRGYERYLAFLASIIRDSTEFVMMGQLEVFLKRHFPETYAMKTDSSLIQDPVAENLFGVRQQDALEHYTRKLMYRRNERRKQNIDKVYRRHVKDPLWIEGVRLDTVISMEGSFLYRYTHTFKSRPGLRKVIVTLDGSIYEKGEKVLTLPLSDGLTFYISSMSSLADEAERYKTVVRERRVSDNTIAFIDFAQGSAEIDTLLGGNASELRRVRKCIGDVAARDDLVLDSLVIVASCSLEGTYGFNKALSEARSKQVCRYVTDFVPPRWRDSLKASSLPENWTRFRLLVGSDTLLGRRAVDRIMKISAYDTGPDKAEEELSALPEYRYLREKIYPKLRTVSFGFYLHRRDMVKDTVHTSELDTVYMSGLRALQNLDYSRAVELLRPYRDYNAALALASSGYDHTAMEILEDLRGDGAKVCYLKAVLLSRMGRFDEAVECFRRAVEQDPSLVHRANLDPEMSQVRQRIGEITSSIYNN